VIAGVAAVAVGCDAIPSEYPKLETDCYSMRRVEL